MSNKRFKGSVATENEGSAELGAGRSTGVDRSWGALRRSMDSGLSRTPRQPAAAPRRSGSERRLTGRFPIIGTTS